MIKNVSCDVCQQYLREHVAKHSYQFSCRGADWAAMSFATMAMQFEPVELHVIDALGQQEVPEYFQQPVKTITEEVCVMRCPQGGRVETSGSE